jgi:hypothetical protein
MAVYRPPATRVREKTSRQTRQIIRALRLFGSQLAINFPELSLINVYPFEKIKVNHNLKVA